MDKAEARTVGQRVLRSWTRKPWAELLAHVDRSVHLDESGATGIPYQVDVNVFWEEKPGRRKPGGALRVIVNVDDGGWRAFFPLTLYDIVDGPK